MADFETAYYLTNKVEGGYVDDPDDRGGMTYRGIARKFHPDWDGWRVVDRYWGSLTMAQRKDTNKHMNKCLDKDEELQELVKLFYQEEFWNTIKGDVIPDQRIANEVYDNAVNMGVEQSGKYLQRTINILNRNQNPKYYKDIKVDGDIGTKTISALHLCVNLNGSKRVLNVINGFQIKHYLELMEKNPVNEKYIGWFDRVEIVWS